MSSLAYMRAMLFQWPSMDMLYIFLDKNTYPWNQKKIKYKYSLNKVAYEWQSLENLLFGKQSSFSTRQLLTLKSSQIVRCRGKLKLPHPQSFKNHFCYGT